MRRRIPRSSMLLAALLAAACTQLKEVPAPTVPVTPGGQPAASDATDIPDPPAFPSSAPTATPTPAPTPTPLPKVTLVSPEETSDFTADDVDITFTATPPDGAKIVEATVSYDGEVIAKLEGPGPTFKVENWNPNQANNLAEEPDAEPVKAGSHKLSFTATDDRGGVGRFELNFEKPLKLLGWQEITAMPAATSHAIAFTDGAFPPSFFNVWGSLDGIESSLVPRTQVFSFNPAGQGSWTQISVTGTAIPRGGYGATMHPGGTVAYLVGGRVGSQDMRTVDVFSPLRKVAEQSAIQMATARRDAAVVYHDDFLYAIGGKAGDSPLYAVERVAIGSDGNPTGVWGARANLQNARAGATAVVQGKEIWVFGGGFRPIEAYDIAKDEWRFLTDKQNRIVGCPEGWANSLMIPVGGRLFFFGGTREDGQAVETIYEFAPRTKTWRTVGALPTIEGLDAADRPETRMSGFFHDGEFYLMGGVSVPENKVGAKVFRAETL